MSLSEEQAKSYMLKLLGAMTRAGGSDLFVSKDFPPSMKIQGKMQPLATQKLTAEVTRELAHALMSERQRAEFAKELECNFSMAIPDLARFRVNVFVQQLNVGMVIRTIPNDMPSFEQLGLPETFKEIVMSKRGMVLVVGATGSGKSTSLAAMVDHRNRSSPGHIITIEDPVEFIHQSQMSLVYEFDRIFDRDDMSWRGTVAVIDHGGQRCRFSGTRGADHQHHAALGHHDFLERLRQSQLLETRHVVGNGSDDHADIQLLNEYVDPEAGKIRDRHGEVAFQLFGKFGALALAHECVRELTGDFRGQFLGGERLHLSLDLHAGRKILRDEQVRAAGARHRTEQLEHVGLGLFFVQRHV